MTESDFEKMLERYLEDRSLPGERALVERLMARLGSKENLQLSAGERELARTAIWERIKQKVDNSTAKAKSMQHSASFWHAPVWRWAAALVAISISLVLLKTSRTQPRPSAVVKPTRQWTQRVNNKMQPQTIELSDGSTVTLFTGSSLKYRPSLSGTRREVYLAGKAFFKVQKDPARPFLVYTDEMLTTVLGTSFLVDAYQGHRETVAVQEGRVSVQARIGAKVAATPTHPAATGIVLLPNQEIAYSGTEKLLKRHLVAQPAVLVPKVFKFRKRPVAEVLDALAESYGVVIDYDKARLANCSVTIIFYDESLFAKLDLLCEVMGAEYRQAEDAKLVFTSKGCQTD